MYTILFVDDYKEIRQFCRRELEKEGYRVILAGDGAEALTVVRRDAPDVIIMDIRMPKLNGFETVKQMKLEKYNIPIIFYTAHREYVQADFRHLGVAGCIEKSEDLTDLKVTIAQVLAHEGQTRGT